MNLPIVAIVGRPNVGKSTLFNRLVGRRIAVVNDEPGVTRDRNYARMDWNRRHFFVVDTGGLVPGDSTSAILKDIRRQAEVAIEEADLVLFVVDGQLEPSTVDLELTKQLYRHAEKVMLVANKMDDERDEWNIGEWMKLGVGEPHPVSALQGRSVGDLLTAVAKRLPSQRDEIVAEDSIRVAVVGRPNVGKSSLVNALLRNERMVVHEEPGTTRDAIDTEVVVEGQRFTLVDTAGLRRKVKVKDPTEYFSSVRTRQSLERSDVALFLLDASVPVSAQDVHVAAEIKDAQRAAILVFNKWDLVAEKLTNTARDMEQDARDRLTFMDYAPAVFLSALTRQRVNKLFPLIAEVYTQATRKFTTGELNRFFERLQKIAPAPANKSGLTPRIYYATQSGTKPPTISLFVNHPRAMAPNYMRFLQNQMRDQFGLEGTPIHLRVRQSK